jgi:2-haloacid dehalogenase
MSVTLAFDVYGTLIDTQGVVSKLQELVGDKAASFSQTWRDKQLEYTFRRGLMQNYQDFSVCTSNALDYTCSFYKEHLSKQQRIVLLDVYRTLPAFNDVQQGLTQLKKAGYRLYAFSNGSADAVETLLVAAGIRKLFLGVISTNDIQSFKPNPAVYRHFLKESNTSANQAWLVSSNSFDVIGAISAGMNAAWVQRSQGAIFDPWGIDPTITVASLLELNEKLADK